jgi:hypothetical protein
VQPGDAPARITRNWTDARWSLRTYPCDDTAMPDIRGRETVVIYPAEHATDTYGNSAWKPSSLGITISGVRMQPRSSVDRHTGAVRPGRRYQLIALQLPDFNGPFAQVKWNGMRFNVLDGPREWTVSTGRRHVSVDLVEDR